jgi:SRSO17 transposase
VSNNHCDTLAQAVPGTSEQRLQECLPNRPWDEEDLHRQRVQKMRAEATQGEGVLVVDDTGFPKQGQAAVGGARPYSGTLGQVGNGQIAVTCCDSDRQATWPVAVRWSVPKTWADDPERRRQAHVPEDVSFQTKPDMALAWLDQARAGASLIAVSWPTPMTARTRTCWPAWRRGRRTRWWRCEPTSR